MSLKIGERVKELWGVGSEKKEISGTYLGKDDRPLNKGFVKVRWDDSKGAVGVADPKHLKRI
jgi:hypothetical protein